MPDAICTRRLMAGVNMSRKQFIAAISSTARDLPDHRKEVMDACLEQEVFPKMMEHLPASPEDAIAASMRLVDKADIYIGVFAYRYGYVPQGHDISITEMEYDRAVARKMPRLIFIMHENHPVKGSDVERGANAVKLDKFKERLQTAQVVNFFESPADLHGQVLNSLSQLRDSEANAELEYEAAVVAMISPSSNPIGAIMNRLEPYPGIPYFSAESDHPSQWPPRVFKDRTAFHQLIVQELSRAEASAELSRWRQNKPPQMQVTGKSQDDPEFNYTLLRNLLIESGEDYSAVATKVGPHCEQALRRLEAARREIEESLPNRLLILRVVNKLDEDVEHFTVEIRLSGSVYEVTLNAEGEKAKSLEWTPSRFSLEIPLLRPNYIADVFVWYYTLPLESRAFPGPMDVRWALTEGIVIENLAASRVQITKTNGLLDNLGAYRRFPVDPVRHSPTFGRLEEEFEEELEVEEVSPSVVPPPPTPNVSRPAADGPYAMTLAVQVRASYRNKSDAYEAQAILSNAVRAFGESLSHAVTAAKGSWLFEFMKPVSAEYNSYGAAYYVQGQLLALLENESYIDLAPMTDAVLLRSGSVSADFVPLNDAKYTVILHFFTDKEDSKNDSKRLLTNPLALSQIFDFDAARAGQRNVAAPEFADLLRYSQRRLTEHYGQPFTLEQSGGETAPFYIGVRHPNVNENFYLPESWMKIAESADDLSTDEKVLASRLSRLYDYANHSEELASAEFEKIFRPSTT